MKVIIFGAGFIGRHVVELLTFMRHSVSIFDRYPPLAGSWKCGYRTFLGDVRDREAVMEAIYQHDGVINLSGILGTMETIDNPHASVDTNVHGALNVFEGCRKNRMNSNGLPCVQIAVGNHFMNNTYAITKTTAERFALMFNKEHGTRIAVVRGLNAYGEYQKHKPVKKITPNFIVSALNKKPIQIFGDGTQVMDMIYVRDLAKILVRALTLDHGCYDRVFEAGTGRKTTVNEIAETVNRIVGNTEGIEHIPMRAGEPEGSVVVGDPATLAPLGFPPSTLTILEDGLTKTVEWYQNNYDWK